VAKHLGQGSERERERNNAVRATKRYWSKSFESRTERLYFAQNEGEGEEE
jgi:hypothetical protein